MKNLIGLDREAALNLGQERNNLMAGSQLFYQKLGG